MSPGALGLRVGLGALGLVGGLVFGEAASAWARGGAFPHLNVYEADAELGVRLRAGASQRVAFGGNPPSDVRINADGFRGAPWGPRAPDEIVVLGDSQAFGLGVEEDETVSARLAVASGRPTINAGVPTYGPLEYLAVIDRVLAARSPKTVVVLVNLGNDLFERDRPNGDRHRVWDGWAVRAETMPDDVVQFPGRAWLFRESHLVFLARRALYRRLESDDRGLPSEGGLADALVRSAVAVRDVAPPPAEDEVFDRPAAGVAAQVSDAARERVSLEHELVESAARLLGEDVGDVGLGQEALRSQNRPGDIVDSPYAEAARPLEVTAELLKTAARLKKDAPEVVRAWVRDHPRDPRVGALSRALARWDAAGAKLDALATAIDGDSAPTSPLRDFVSEARARCARAGAELVIAALPLDVQVSPEEWRKYGKEPVDLSETRRLSTDLVAVARHAGARGVDLWDPLAAASPGAFLMGDLHMSPIGTAAVADALAAALTAPAPLPAPESGLPPGRSRLPTTHELALAPEIVVRGSTRNRCSTRRLREWLIIECAGLTFRGSVVGGTTPSVAIEEAPLETAWGTNYGATSVLLPLLPGRAARVVFSWAATPESNLPDTLAADAPFRGRREVFVLGWDEDRPIGRFEPFAGPFEPAARPECARNTLERPWSNADLGCARTWSDPCSPEHAACAAGDGTSPPVCAAGEAPVGSSGWCHPLCDDATPCARGVCSEWMGAKVCL